MKNLIEIINDVNDAIDEYDTLQLKQITHQSEILRKLSTAMYYLSQHRIDAHEKWLSYNLNSTSKSQSGKDKEADLKTPELYKIRQIMGSVKIIIDSIRSTISVHKNDSGFISTKKH